MINLKAQLSTTQWVELPAETRQQLKAIFNIPKSGGREVTSGPRGAVVISDGHTHRDLAVITVEAMQNYLGSIDTDFYLLFDQVLKVVAEKQKNNIDETKNKIESENVAKWLMTLREIKNRAIELGLSEQFKTLVQETFGIQAQPVGELVKPVTKDVKKNNKKIGE